VQRIRWRIYELAHTCAFTRPPSHSRSHSLARSLTLSLARLLARRAVLFSDGVVVHKVAGFAAPRPQGVGQRLAHDRGRVYRADARGIAATHANSNRIELVVVAVSAAAIHLWEHRVAPPNLWADHCPLRVVCPARRRSVRLRGARRTVRYHSLLCSANDLEPTREA
jgi:hypothetical protein